MAASFERRIGIVEQFLATKLVTEYEKDKSETHILEFRHDKLVADRLREDLVLCRHKRKQVLKKLIGVLGVESYCPRLLLDLQKAKDDPV